MFKRINCPKCNKIYDDANQFCPHCGEVNSINKKARGTKNVTFVHFIKQLGLFFIQFLGFQVIGTVIALIIGIVGTTKYGYSGDQLTAFLSSVQNTCIMNFVGYGVTFIALIALLWKDNFKVLKTFKKWQAYVAGIIGFAALVGFNYLYTGILTSCGVKIGDSDNQGVIVECVKLAPVASIIFFAILGPITEELGYRLGLYSFFRRINKYLAYAITIVIFTLIHFTWTSKDLANELLNLPIYCFGAFTLTFLYEKFGFASSTTAHILNNMFSIIAIIITTK